ncbi:MAG: shikimate dehydrogenase, partial [Flavobacteriaceae bacterium]|nr:shikimate dehydrogenase [Flavobacteriaceae bacterium]
DLLNLDYCEYQNFDIETIEDFTGLISTHKKLLCGMNITIPYKESVMPFLDELDEDALEIGAVNTIKFMEDGRLKGYNTDVVGFQKSIVPLINTYHKKALILGTGGAAKAIAFVLKKLNIDFLYVSRNPQSAKEISYIDLDEDQMSTYQIIINCTPLGTFPETEKCPDIPYQHLGDKHLLFDLIYNPSTTTFLQKGKEEGALIKNGLEMLQLQAEESWGIWNN